MTEDWAAREAALLEKLEHRVQAYPTFSKEEVEALRVLIKAYRGWAAFGWFAKWIIYMLAALAGAITAVKTIGGALKWW